MFETPLKYSESKKQKKLKMLEEQNYKDSLQKIKNKNMIYREKE
jgi:hypothetical protein